MHMFFMNAPTGYRKCNIAYRAHLQMYTSTRFTINNSMCKHFVNAQVSVRTQCCRKWYDCPTCHEENETHPLKKTAEITLICKKCKKAFRKDLSDFDESDSFCPNCDNEFMIPSASEAEVVAPPTAQESVLSKLSHLDPRMIRDGDVNDEELGFDVDYSRKLG